MKCVGLAGWLWHHLGMVYGMPPPATGRGNKRGTRKIIFGAILLFVGVVITIVSYAAASAAGGVFFVMYGPVVVGLISIISGGIEVSRSKGGITAIANWYPDPQDPRWERYWDGRAWSGHVRPAPRS